MRYRCSFPSPVAANGGHCRSRRFVTASCKAATKIVLEPIFEADMLDCSFGFRPRRSAHDALQVLIDESWRGRRWVVETDIASCFEAIPHHELMLAVQERVSDQAPARAVATRRGHGHCQQTRPTPTSGPAELANRSLRGRLRRARARHPRRGRTSGAGSPPPTGGGDRSRWTRSNCSASIRYQ